MLQLELSLQTENKQGIKMDVPNISEIEKLTE